MISYKIDPTLFTHIPTFKIGLVTYHHIVISDSPQMLKGRLQFFQETLRIDLEDKPITDFPGIISWRETFKKLSISPSKYRPSSEALFRRIKKGEFISAVHSAVDINNFFSLKYEIPIGIYNLEQIEGNIVIRLGKESDKYFGLNGREQSMSGKLISSDEAGAFGSPIVDSKKTKTTVDTTNAIQIFYLRSEMSEEESLELLHASAKMFEQIHGGTSTVTLLSSSKNSVIV
ncbi:tRNA synthetase subunit beta [Alkalihalobacillus alcalophilus ATCC 27647 = CGMCC 1.3604]|uniref:tRNA synthetase subunit beta n=1 Tax=Alkalihalobacillus alcalophilus ATCC 27647 = CGMCC 1.3604 TaxID=1218173 RepID=A0A094XBA9_ALKAL|nr:phenylalanine--tRNA ligase beta subunit-related protein [Alkalihalobacillus alcalophilus]KGA96090.1 tRNA synthetase subunit beta [Alkalihalobacillus alcalophilus ATCC 27647 = CGMCC 1.3604]MED1561078.1 phenylalanine--tRNA ligase beta subunit-related protein [Alkalihalobacillus alcalophilus]THG90086.1 tRNA synthetase subunit beta [Alkalihalobacillus alcalophilus ATCC 27647 = CGMCC 1.3604]